MTKLTAVKQHYRRSPEPNPKQRELHERLQYEVRLNADLVAALEEALAEFKPEEGLQS